ATGNAVHLLALRDGWRPAHHVQPVPSAEELHSHADPRRARKAALDRASDRVFAMRRTGRYIDGQRMYALRRADRADRSGRGHESAAGALLGIGRVVAVA